MESNNLGSNNSPSKVLSRAIHGNYFNLIPESIMENDGWNEKIKQHQEKCQHPICRQSRSI